MRSLKKLIYIYEQYFLPLYEKEVLFLSQFRNNREELCRLVAWAITSNGTTHRHQCRIAKSVKEFLEAYLYENFDELIASNDFEVIMKRLIKIEGIAQLTAFDVTKSLVTCYGIFPQKVYIHRGAYEGAKNLLGHKAVKGRSSLYVHEFPKELHQLTPSHIENFLCIFKNDFKNIKSDKIIRSCYGTLPKPRKVC